MMMMMMMILLSVTVNLQIEASISKILSDPRFLFEAMQCNFCFRSIIHLTCLNVSCLLLFMTWIVQQKLEMELLYLN